MCVLFGVCVCVSVKTWSCATLCMNFNFRAAEFPANTLRVINILTAQNCSHLLTHQKTLTLPLSIHSTHSHLSWSVVFCAYTQTF